MVDPTGRRPDLDRGVYRLLVPGLLASHALRARSARARRLATWTMSDPPSRVDPALVAERLAAVRARLAAVGGAAVEILPVTKGFDESAIAAVRSAGLGSIGENYAQELVAKRAACDGLRVHFIGQLQTNKVRQIADLVDVYETVDRERLVKELAKRAPGARVLVQIVPDDADPGKGGCRVEHADALVEHAREAGLQVDGVMAVGPTEGGPEAARPIFRSARALVDRHGLEVCSIGMSADLEVAVEEGSTQVRVGTALLGPRPVPARRDQGR